jgi:hypothetical protein
MRWLWNIPMWCHGSDENASDFGAFNMVGFLIRDAEPVTRFKEISPAAQ